MKDGRGQSLGELVILLGIVAIVFSVMQVYMQRNFQGRVLDLTDKIVRTDPETDTKLDLKPYTAKDSKSLAPSYTRVSGATTFETKTGGRVIKTVNETTRTGSNTESTGKY